MTVAAAHAYTSPLNTHETYAARTAAKDEQKTTAAVAPTGTAAASITNQSADNAVAGTTGSRLSAETTGFIIQATQETDTSNVSFKEYQGVLSESERRHLEQVANDPGYAKQMSESIGTAQDLVRIHESQMPKNGGDPAYAKAFYERMDGLQLKASEEGDKRTSFYKSQVDQGISSAQTYANLMEFNASLSQDYWNSLSIGFEKSNQTTEHFQASHDYLQNLIDQRKAAPNGANSTIPT